MSNWNDGNIRRKRKQHLEYLSATYESGFLSKFARHLGTHFLKTLIGLFTVSIFLFLLVMLWEQKFQTQQGRNLKKETATELSISFLWRRNNHPKFWFRIDPDVSGARGSRKTLLTSLVLSLSQFWPGWPIHSMKMGNTCDSCRNTCATYENNFVTNCPKTAIVSMFPRDSWLNLLHGHRYLLTVFHCKHASKRIA